MMQTLKQRTVLSGSWVIGGHLVSQILRFGGNLILTRLLVPEMFGVMAIVTVIMGGLAMFSDVGLLQNIVQSKRGEEPDYLDTAWTIQIIRGFFIFLIALMASGGLYYFGQEGLLSTETVYGHPELPLILAIVSITAIISGFNSIHILLLNRKLMMGKLIIIGVVSQAAGLFFMLIWAWYQRDIWALVYGGIISAIIKMTLSHSIIQEGKSRLFWDRKAAYEIFHFGKWIFLTSIFGFLLNQGDRLLLGGLMTSEALGIYTIAFFLANALKDIIMKLVSSVLFPVLSLVIREQPENVQNTYYRLRAKIDSICMFAAGFLYSTGSVIINTLYDHRYGDAGWMLEVLSLSLVSVGFMLAGQLFLAYGKPKLMSVLAAFQVAGLFVGVPLLFFLYGIDGAIWAIALNPIIRMVVSLVIMKKIFFLQLHKEIMFIPLIVVGFVFGEQFNKIIS